MSKFVITSSKKDRTYIYESDDIKVNGTYQAEEETGMVLNITGACYRTITEPGTSDYIGNFNGTMRNGEIKYSLSEMSRKDSMLVWNAIDEIEQNILPQPQGEL
jgi:hypothetical protein